MKWTTAASSGVVFGFLIASPVHAQDARVNQGEQIYSDYCSSCHGEKLQNTSGGVTFDLRRLKPNEHERFVTSVNNGKGQMPPWNGMLDENQIDAIWAYIMSKSAGG